MSWCELMEGNLSGCLLLMLIGSSVLEVVNLGMVTKLFSRVGCLLMVCAMMKFEFFYLLTCALSILSFIKRLSLILLIRSSP